MVVRVGWAAAVRGAAEVEEDVVRGGGVREAAMVEAAMAAARTAEAPRGGAVRAVGVEEEVARGGGVRGAKTAEVTMGEAVRVVEAAAAARAVGKGHMTQSSTLA